MWLLLPATAAQAQSRPGFALRADAILAVPDNLALTQVASGLNQPVSIANARDGSGRLFIVQRPGQIRILDTTTGTLLVTPYLDISAIVDDSGSEQGLLGLAFHPDFSSNRQFYVYYIRDPGADPDRSVVAMYQQSLGNPDIADTTATVLMEFEQNAANHNGGDLHFGPDGYLYIASGDGGGGGDQYNNAQNEDSLKGKILRIDVDGTPPVGGELCGLSPAYGIPAGNAFPGSNDGCDEILHLGLRNPWRFSFDAQTEELYIGDVGQASWEEIDHAPAAASGLNFGWPCLEGTHEYRDDVVCPNPVAPIIEYPSSGSGVTECSVTGGYVYRGSGAALNGHYVYGDYCSDRIWVAARNGAVWTSEEWVAAAAVLDSITAFGQDERCELYVADANAGLVYRIDDTERVARSGFEALRCQ
jgi:glucose/arabinose dehydrogenase